MNNNQDWLVDHCSAEALVRDMSKNVVSSDEADRATHTMFRFVSTKGEKGPLWTLCGIRKEEGDRVCLSFRVHERGGDSQSVSAELRDGLLYPRIQSYGALAAFPGPLAHLAPRDNTGYRLVRCCSTSKLGTDDVSESTEIDHSSADSIVSAMNERLAATEPTQFHFLGADGKRGHPWRLLHAHPAKKQLISLTIYPVGVEALRTIELEMKLDNEGLLHHERTLQGTPFSTGIVPFGDKALHNGCLIVPRPIDNRPIILDHSSWDKLEADLIGRNELLQLVRPDGARWRINSIIVNDKDRVLTLSTSMMDNTRTTRQLRCQVRNNGLYPREDDNQVGHIATTQEASTATTHHTAISRGTYETALAALTKPMETTEGNATEPVSGLQFASVQNLADVLRPYIGGAAALTQFHFLGADGEKGHPWLLLHARPAGERLINLTIYPVDSDLKTIELEMKLDNEGLLHHEQTLRGTPFSTALGDKPIMLHGGCLIVPESQDCTDHTAGGLAVDKIAQARAENRHEWKVQRILNHNSTPALVRDLNKCESEGCWLGFVRAPGTELGSNYSCDYPTTENALIIDANNPWKTSGSNWPIGSYGKVNIHDNAGQHHVCQWRLSHERGRVGVIEDSRDGVDSQQTNLGFIAALTKQPMETTEGNAAQPAEQVSGQQFASVKELLAGLRHKHTGPQFRFIDKDGRKGEPWYLQAVCKTPQPATQVCPGEEWDIRNCVTLTVLAAPNTPCTQIHMRFSPADGQLRVVEWGLFRALGHENWLRWLGEKSTQGTSKYYIPEWQQGRLHEPGQRILSRPGDVPIEEPADSSSVLSASMSFPSGILDHNSAETIVVAANKLLSLTPNELFCFELFCFVSETGQDGPAWRMHSISVVEDGVVWLRLSTGDAPFGVWLRSCGGRLWHMSSTNLPDHWSLMKLLISPSEDVSGPVPLVGRIRHLGSKGSPEVELADAGREVTEKPSAPAVTNIDHSSLDALLGGLCEVGGGDDAAVKLFRVHGIVEVSPDRWFCFVNDAGEEGPSWRMSHIATHDKGKTVWMSILADKDTKGDPCCWKTTDLHLSLSEGRLRHQVSSIGDSWDALRPLVAGSEPAANYDCCPSLGRIRCLGISRPSSSCLAPIEELADAVSEHRRKRSKGFNVCTNCNRLLWTETDDLCRPCQLTALKHDAAWEDGKLVVGSLFADNNSDNPSVAETAAFPPLSNKVGLGKPSSGKKLPKPWPRWVKILALLCVMAVAYNANCIIEHVTEWKAGSHTKALVHRAAATWEWVKSGPAIRRAQNKRESTAPPSKRITSNTVQSGPTPPSAVSPSPIVHPFNFPTDEVQLWAIILIGVLFVCAVVIPCRSSGPISSREALSEVHHPTKESKNGQ